MEQLNAFLLKKTKSLLFVNKIGSLVIQKFYFLQQVINCVIVTLIIVNESPFLRV